MCARPYPQQASAKHSAAGETGREVIENDPSTDVESPPPPCSDVG
jgi:hypothetical protein